MTKGVPEARDVDKSRKKLLKLATKLQKVKDSSERAKLVLKLEKRLKQSAQLAEAVHGDAPKSSNPNQPAVPNAPLASKRRTAGIAPLRLNAEEADRRQERLQRFDAPAGHQPTQANGMTLRAARAAARNEVYGESTALTKEYLRLTALPTLDSVRPPGVLATALRAVQQRWLQDANYGYACEQLKAIRQDLTVQHCAGALSVATYETHARIALEANDLAEFNQCQTALANLFRQQVPGNEMEFHAYGLLYTAAVHPQHLSRALRGLPRAALGHRYVRHALQACLAARARRWPAFLALYSDAPRMSPYLMDRLLPMLRRAALGAARTAFRPGLPLARAAALLGFATQHEAAAYLTQQGELVDEERETLVLRA